MRQVLPSIIVPLTDHSDLPRTQFAAPRPRRRTVLGAMIVIWCLWGALAVGLVAFPAVRRTQEARVLETAREMLGAGLRGWMVPHLNGQMRLQKPPLAYWLSAASFKTFGVSEWAGRLPSVLAAWLTIALVYHIAAYLFCRRAAIFAALAIASSWLFCRSIFRAETDGLASLFVTLAIYCIWRAAGDGAQGRRWLWFHLSSVAIALASMSKGPPALFALLFLLALAAAQRSFRPVWQWARCGAPLTLLALAAPWWVYLLSTFGRAVIWRELHDVVAGEDHPGWFFNYIPWLLVAVMPWSLLMPAALWQASQRWSDDRVRGLLLWTAVVLLPLCTIGNKQDHYLLPVIPPLMILVGWLLDSAMGMGGEPHPDRRSHLILGGVRLTLIASLLSVAAILIAASKLLGKVRAVDIGAALALAAILVLVLWLHQKRGALWGMIGYGVSCSVAMLVLLALWTPSLNRSNTRDMAAALRAGYGAGPYCFHGEGVYLPLCFAMRQRVPYLKTPDELTAAAATSPGLIVLAQAEESGNAPKPVDAPPGFQRIGTIGADDQRILIFRRSRAEDQR